MDDQTNARPKPSLGVFAAEGMRDQASRQPAGEAREAGKARAMVTERNEVSGIGSASGRVRLLPRRLLDARARWIGAAALAFALSAVAAAEDLPPPPDDAPTGSTRDSATAMKVRATPAAADEVAAEEQVSAVPDLTSVEDRVEDLDWEIAEIERLIEEAYFRVARALATSTGRRLESMSGDGVQLRRARVAVLSATAELALGHRQKAREHVRVALRANPALLLDESATSPKLVKIFEGVRTQLMSESPALAEPGVPSPQ